MTDTKDAAARLTQFATAINDRGKVVVWTDDWSLDSGRLGQDLHALLAERDRLREALVQADLTIRSFPTMDQSAVAFIRAALGGDA